MKIFLTTAELTRRAGLARQTLEKRLAAQGIRPDGLVLNGKKTPGPLYDSEKLPKFLAALTTEQPK